MPEESEHKTIKQWNEDDRPREKMEKHGSGILSNAELLAILICNGTKNKSAVDVCRDLMRNYGDDLGRLMDAPINQLTKIDGIGRAKAITIKAAMELIRRRPREARRKISIKCSRDIYEYISQDLEYLDHEEIWVLYLDHGLRVISFDKETSGTEVASLFNKKEIIRKALDYKACSLVMAHNHPSNNLKPSRQDKEITKSLFECAKLFDINLIDHLIIGEGDYYSFNDNGEL